MQVVCPDCGGINRIPDDRPAIAAKCGKCKHALFQKHAVNVDTAGLQRHIAKNDIPVVVDFWASWCGPCKMMAPLFEQAAATMEPQVRFLKLNTESEQQLSAQLGIRSIPTMILFKQGKEAARTAGAMDANSIVSWIRQHS